MKRPIEPKKPYLIEPQPPLEENKYYNEFKMIKRLNIDDGDWHNKPIKDFMEFLQRELYLEKEDQDNLVLQIDSNYDYEFGGSVLFRIGKMVQKPNSSYNYQVKTYKNRLKYYEKVLPKHQVKMKKYEADMIEYRVQLKTYNEWEKERRIKDLKSELKKLEGGK